MILTAISCQHLYLAIGPEKETRGNRTAQESEGAAWELLLAVSSKHPAGGTSGGLQLWRGRVKLQELGVGG